MANAIGKVSIELEAKVAKLESDLKKAATSLEREMSKMRHATQKSMADISANTAKASKSIDDSFAKIGRTMKTGFAAVGIAQTVIMLSKMADNYSNISARVKLAAGANANFEKSMAAILKTSLTTYQSLDATARLTQKISQGLQSTGVSAKESFSKAIELTEVFNKALVVSGAGTIQAESAMLQFSQAISKGKLDGDEFRSVMETNGAFMSLLASTLGVTTGALYKLREEGKLTNDVLFMVTQNAGQLEEQFAKFPLTIARAAKNFESAMTVFIGQSDQAVGASRALAEVISLVADNLSTIANVALGAAALIGVSKAFGMITVAIGAMRSEVAKVAGANAIWVEQRAAIVASAQASAANTAAKAAEITRTLEVVAVVRQETLAKLAATQADIAAQKATLARVATMATLPMTIRLQEQATTALAAAQARQAAMMGPLAVLGRQEANLRIQLAGAAAQQVLAMSTLSSANSSLVKAQGATVASMGALRAAGAGLFAMMGGWPMLIAAVAIGFGYFISKADEATDAAIEQANAMEAAGAKAAAASKYTKDAEIAAFAESIAASQRKLEASYALIKSYEDLKAAAAATGTPINQYSLTLEVAANQAERASADVKLLSGSIRDNSIALVEMTGGEAKVKSFLASFERISHVNELLEFMGVKARETAEALNVLSAAGTAQDFVEDIQKENRQLLEKIVNIRGGIEAVNAMKMAEMDMSKMSKAQRAEMEASIKTNNALTADLKLAEDAQRAKEKAVKDGIKTDEKAAKEVERLTEAIKDNARAAAELAGEALGPLEQEYEKMVTAQEEWRKKLKDGETTAKDAKKAIDALAESYKKKKKEVEADAAAQAYANDILARTIEAHKKEAASLGLTARAAFVYAEVMQAATRAQQLFQDKQRESPNLSAEEKAGIEASAAALYDLGVAAEHTARIAADFEDTWINAGHSAADAISDFAVEALSNITNLEDAWENLGDAMVDIIKQSVGEMISEFLKLQIVNPILNSIFSNFGGASLPSASGGGIFGNIMSMLGGSGSGTGMMGNLMSSLGSMFGMGGGFTAAGAGGLAPIFSGSTLLGGATTTATSGLVGLGGSTGGGLGAGASGMMAALPWAAIAAAVVANFQLMQSGWGATGGSTMLPNGQSIRGGGSGSARGLDDLARLASGLFTANSTIAGILSGSAIHNRLFGRKAPEVRSGTTTMNLGPGGGSGSEVYRAVERGGTFRSDRWRNHTFDLGEDAQAALDEMFAAVRQTMRDSAAMLEGEAPEMISAALRVVQEFDSKGKVTATKYFVDVLGRSWEEATEEAANNRIHAEAMIATIDAILGTTVTATEAAMKPIAAAITAGSETAAREIGGFVDGIVKGAGVLGEASSIAERWRDDADMLLEGAQFLLLAATDIRAGVGLLGDGGTLTQITELIEDLQHEGESLADTYSRVAEAASLYRMALELQGTQLNHYGEDFVRFANDIAEAAGGIERARGLWQGYFDAFFTANERAEHAVSRAQANADTQLDDIGMTSSSYQGRSGLARFRADFEAAQIAGLTAQATVEWLEAGNALAILVQAQEEYNDTITDSSEALVAANVANRQALDDFMSGILDDIENLTGDVDYGRQFARLNAEFALLIKEAIALGAGEEELGRIREYYQLRYNAILDDQRASLEAQEQASRDLASYVLQLNTMTQNGGSLPSYIQRLMQLREEYENHVSQLNEYAVAAGRAGASQEELASATGLYAAQLEAYARELIAAGRGLVARLYGPRQTTGGRSSSSSSDKSAGGDKAHTDPIDEGNDIGGGLGSTMNSINQINEAVEDRYARELALLEDLRRYVESLTLSSLSPLTPEERLMEAQSQYEDLLARAMAGDLDALEQLQEAANTYLGEAQSYYGGVGNYGGIFDSVRDALMALVNQGPLSSPGNGGGPTVVTGPGGGGVNVEPGDGFAELSALERQALAQELAAVMRDIMMVTGQSLLEVSEQLGVDLQDLVGDLGVDLNELTVETTLALVEIADMLGVSLTELAESVGFQLGLLADQNSLISQALASTINTLPSGIASTLNTHLAAIRNATTVAGQLGATEEMTNYINTLPNDIRNALDEFFPGVMTDEELMWRAAIDMEAHIETMKGFSQTTASMLTNLNTTLGPTYASQILGIHSRTGATVYWLEQIERLLRMGSAAPSSSDMIVESKLDMSEEDDEVSNYELLTQLKTTNTMLASILTAGNNNSKEAVGAMKDLKSAINTRPSRSFS